MQTWAATTMAQLLTTTSVLEVGSTALCLGLSAPLMTVSSYIKTSFARMSVPRPQDLECITLAMPIAQPHVGLTSYGLTSFRTAYCRINSHRKTIGRVNSRWIGRWEISSPQRLHDDSFAIPEGDYVPIIIYETILHEFLMSTRLAASALRSTTRYAKDASCQRRFAERKAHISPLHKIGEAKYSSPSLCRLQPADPHASSSRGPSRRCVDSARRGHSP